MTAASLGQGQTCAQVHGEGRKGPNHSLRHPDHMPGEKRPGEWVGALRSGLGFQKGRGSKGSARTETYHRFLTRKPVPPGPLVFYVKLCGGCTHMCAHVCMCKPEGSFS